MIVLKIAGDDERTVVNVAGFLLRKKLIIDVNIDPHVERLYMNGDQLESKKVCLMTAKTKALLFGNIDQLVLDNFPGETLEIYSTPIVHMDWDETVELRKSIVEV